MKRWISIAWLFLFVFVGIFGFGTDALAAEADPGWRGTYDLVLRWINFAILAFIIVKYARTPLKNFIFGQRQNLVREMERKEAEKKTITEKVDAVISELKESETRLESLKERIISHGRRKRQEIIDSAREQSRQMLSDVRQRMNSQILQAKQEFKSELVEVAVGLAMDKLPQIINENDNQMLLDNFLAGTGTK
jgi:F-type H+-transporting ATPase subunit b